MCFGIKHTKCLTKNLQLLSEDTGLWLELLAAPHPISILF